MIMKQDYSEFIGRDGFIYHLWNGGPCPIDTGDSVETIYTNGNVTDGGWLRYDDEIWEYERNKNLYPNSFAQSPE